MRMITRMADRLLSTVVPEITAGACCPQHGQQVINPCYCSGGHVYEQTCYVDCGCHRSNCTACREIGTRC